MKKLWLILLCLALTIGLFPTTGMAAPDWPSNLSIEAEGGIVMDADTGAVLYGQNILIPYYPASITKILTALIVLERCDMNETVTFSHNAVFNVEAGSSSAGLDVGDQLSVRDTLYAMMLKSANEAANALAEHVAGTTEEFAVLMNEKAKSLGCTDSNFVNPHGLNDSNHYTTAYDMALIGKAALQNKDFVEIDSTLYYDLPVTKRNPEGARIYPGHKMIKKNWPEYYPNAIGGKTGYTSLAGNTLVTFAKKDGMTLVAVILNGHQTHYSDTKKLLDFGFDNFQSVIAADYDSTYTSVDNDMTIAGLAASNLSGLTLDKTGKVTIPKTADFSAVTSSISYELTEDDPKDAIAKIQYTYGDRKIGATYLELKRTNEEAAVPSTTLDAISALTLEAPAAPTESPAAPTESPAAPTEFSAAPVEAPAEKKPFRIPSVVWTILIVLLVLGLLLGAVIAYKTYQERKERLARERRRERRLHRMSDDSLSSAEFDLLMEQKRASYTSKQRPYGRQRWKNFHF